MDGAITFEPTEGPDFETRRKALGSAFSRSKISDMTQCIKEVTIKEVQRIQKLGVQEINLVTTCDDLQSRIIINLSVGAGSAEKPCNFENDDGSISQISLCVAISRQVEWVVSRFVLPF
jgi:cytochrome P450